MEWIENVGKFMKDERLSWGMSRTKLAKLSYVDRDIIEEIENGIIKDPDFYDMLKLCEVLDTSVFFYLKKEKRVM